MGKVILVNRLKSFTIDKASLYLVSTPIGNLEDITIRAINTLKKVDYIYCEDTRVSRVLLKYYDINTPLFTYHDHNKEYKVKEVINLLNEGKNVALISDAGTPLISDPGYVLVKEVIKEKHPVIPIPGPSAVLSALVSSGFPPHPFLFVGFLDAKASKREQQLTNFKNFPYPIVFYESPHRINKTISSLYKVFGERKLVVARELTKLHEEFIRGTTKTLLDLPPLKGEMVLIIEGNKETKTFTDKEIINQVDYFIKQGYTTKDAIKLTSKTIDKNKNDIYNLYHLKNKE